MNKKIGILLHFHGDKAMSPDQMWQIMCYIMEMLSGCAELFSITIELNCKDDIKSNRFVLSDLKPVFSIGKQINMNTCHVRFSFDTPNQSEAIAAYACISRSNYLSQPMIKNEQTIYISLNSDVWYAAQDYIIDKIIYLCKKTTISYVAVDKHPVAPRSVYKANIRIVSDMPNEQDIETKVPGIYWGQYLSLEMLNGNAFDDEMLKKNNITFRRVSEGSHQGIWLQTSKSLKRDTKEKHKMLYSLLEQYAYPIDVGILKQNKNLLAWMFDRYPI